MSQTGHERSPAVTSEIAPNRLFADCRDGIDGARTCHAAAGTRRELLPPPPGFWASWDATSAPCQAHTRKCFCFATGFAAVHFENVLCPMVDTPRFSIAPLDRETS